MSTTDPPVPATAFWPSQYTAALLQALRLHPEWARDARVLEIGCGSGVLLAAAGRLGAAALCGVDLEPAAVAATGALLRGLDPAAAIEVHQGDLFVPVRGRRFDLVLANLPHFPMETAPIGDRLATWSSGGADGRRLLDPFLAGLGCHLAPGGRAVIAHNAFIGLEATQAAFAHGETWRQALMAYLQGNRDWLAEAVAELGHAGLAPEVVSTGGTPDLFRAHEVAVATDPSFIHLIQHDSLEHWRHGHLRLLTGEDKSAAFWLLARGRRTLYVPDVQVLTIEQPPAPDLLRASTVLMLRWFGNMLRASGRCLALGPGRVGWFIWWCLLDQRVSMWTPLVGPIGAVLLSLAVSPAFLYAYLLWVMATRLVQTALLLTVRPTISGLYPPLLYYSQLYGALLKTWALFHLDRQRWTRQNISWAPDRTPSGRWLQAAGSLALHVLALVALTTGVALATGVLPLPQIATLGRLL